MRFPRPVFTLLGLLCVGLGFVGMAVPGMPTTIFMILGLYFFKKSSPRLEAWLLNHSWFGPTLRDWEEHRSIRRRTKIIAVSTLWLFAGVSLVLINIWPVRAIVFVVCAWVTWFILSRRTVPDERPAGLTEAA